MAADFEPLPDRYHGPLPSERLIAYIRGQFLDAARKEEAEGERGESSLNGTFIQRVPLDTDEAGRPMNPLVRGSRRIILKPPHPNDLPGFHCEVFAVRFDEEARTLPNLEYLEKVDLFILRDYTNKQPGGFWALGPDGPYQVDAPSSPNEELIGHDLESPRQDAESQADELIHGLRHRLETAEEMLAKYSTYNIVAVTE